MFDSVDSVALEINFTIRGFVHVSLNLLKMSVSENANKQELPKFNHIYVFQPRYGEQAIASVKDFLIYTTADKSSFTNWGLRYART